MKKQLLALILILFMVCAADARLSLVVGDGETFFDPSDELTINIGETIWIGVHDSVGEMYIARIDHSPTTIGEWTGNSIVYSPPVVSTAPGWSYEGWWRGNFFDEGSTEIPLPGVGGAVEFRGLECGIGFENGNIRVYLNPGTRGADDYLTINVTPRENLDLPGWTRETKLTDPNCGYLNGYGSSTFIDGEFLWVGALFEDSNGFESGAAYIYKRDGQDWVEKARLTASDGYEHQFFGYSISSGGDYAIIGAAGDSENGLWSGAAYIFKRDGDNWVEQAKLIPSDNKEDDSFGHAVAITGDYALIGSPWKDGVVDDSGAVYVFKRDGENWIEQDKLMSSSPEYRCLFGTSISISNNYAIVAAVGDNDFNGSAYIFKLENERWIKQTKLTASDSSQNTWFGVRVYIDRDTAIVGAPLDDNDNGKRSGSAYIFKRDGVDWTEQAKLTALDGQPYEGFGISVAISGSYAIVGGLNIYGRADESSAYIFRRESANWIQDSKLQKRCGLNVTQWDISVSMNENLAAIGLYDGDQNDTGCGSVYVFQRKLIEAELEVRPKTLNLARKADLRCTIQLPEEFDVNTIDVDSIWLETKTAGAAASQVLIDQAGKVAIAKFDSTQVADIFEADDQVEVTIKGELTDRTMFKAADVIRVINKGRKKPHPKINIAPEVSIITPRDGERFDMYNNQFTISIEADAQDVDGEVTEVRFFVGDNLIAIDHDGSDGWSIDWRPIYPRDYTLTATAIDNDAAETLSEPVNIRIVSARYR